MRRTLLGVVALLIAGCGTLQGGQPAPSASPTPTATPTPSGSALSQVELKYRLLAQVGPIDFCDPDLYPVGREVTAPYVQQRLLAIQAGDAQTYQAILDHHGLTGTLTEAQQMAVYTDYKQLAALPLTTAGDRYGFDYHVSQGASKEPVRTIGLIDRYGSISVQSRVPGMFACPICLTGGTLIDTPNGPVRIDRLEPGAIVWTTGVSGVREAGPVLRVASMEGGPGFAVHVRLSDGRELWASPNHQLADGRRLVDLLPGVSVDGGRVALAELLPSSAATYDLLPAGPTGTYWANGILLASTLMPSTVPGSARS